MHRLMPEQAGSGCVRQDDSGPSNRAHLGRSVLELQAGHGKQEGVEACVCIPAGIGDRDQRESSKTMSKKDELLTRYSQRLFITHT